MPSAGWTAGLLVAGFILGWWGVSFVNWWRREEEREGEEFERLFSSGISHLIAGRSSEAIDELTRAARLRTDVPAVYLILGDLFRDRGRFDRAIRIHSALLHRSDLGRSERAQALTSLGEDYRTSGLGDRAKEAFRRALELDSRSIPALRGLLKFEIEARNWMGAVELEEQVLRTDANRSGHTLSFLYYEMGMEALRSDDEKTAFRAFQKAVAVNDRAHPARLFLGDLHHKDGRLKKAIEAWEKIIELKPRLLHVVYDRLEQAYGESGDDGRLDMISHRIAEQDPADWRVRVLLARRENDRGNPEAAYGYLLDASRAHPGSVTVQREIWRMTVQRGLDRKVAREMMEITKGGDIFADPYVCSTCRFRTSAYLWRCPQCHEWETFTEAPVAPATMTDTSPAPGTSPPHD
jgi:lipopolysaccharide biosynthesis regulator YciM